jgi:hypothetical protein
MGEFQGQPRLMTALSAKLMDTLPHVFISFSNMMLVIKKQIKGRQHACSAN